MRRIFVTTIVTALCATPAAFAIACIGFAAISRALAAEAPKPLQLEAKIALGEVAGRIDHMAVDTERRRLFVAELGNNTLGVVDLVERRLLQRLTGLREPQGVGYDPSADIVYVANARDGSVHLFHGPAYTPKATIALGADADNIRIDPTGHRVIVGYGQGALAVIDAATQGRVRDIHLPQHPEGFQLDPETNRIFVNLPDERAVAVVDAAEGKLIATWPQTGRSGNFPMALDPVRRQVLAVFRNPALLAVLAMADGAPKAKVPVCSDSDDVFVDTRRQRAYVTCGEGFVDVFDLQASFARLAHIPTAAGARTSLFMADLDLLAIAVPARGATPAAIWLYRPTP